ncbi:MAG: hypothetical protein AAF629_36965 [Chloroflexota bacterium]
MAVITPEFLAKLQQTPDQTISIIITVLSNAKDHVPEVEQLGLDISHTYSLRPMIAASGPAQAIIDLSTQDWVQKIEPDGEVRAL